MQNLEKSQWDEFLENVNEKIEAADILVAANGTDEQGEAKLESASLLSVTFDEAADEACISLFGGDVVIKQVVSIEPDFEDGELSGLEISGKDDATCLIRFNNPICLTDAAVAA
jgi:hypothetical protein